MYADLIHPFGLMLTLASAVYIGGIPVAICDRPAGRRSSTPGWSCAAPCGGVGATTVSSPGAGEPTTGYQVRVSDDELDFSVADSLARLDPAALWEER